MGVTMTSEEETVMRRGKRNEVLNCLTEEEIDKYNEAFTIFDKNQSGRISMAELGEVMTNLGRSKPSLEELQDIMEELDTDRSGGVDFEEFLQFMTKENGCADKKDEFREAFDVMDTDGDGNISADDLKKVMGQLGCNLGKEDLEEMIKV